ncbi:MAG: MFS transporter [Saprospiraceae bacterium]|nr:MFS transporter [Saprospiraceae bacterium]
MPTSLFRFFNAFQGLSREIWLLSAVSLINRSGAMVVAFLTLYLTQSLHYDIKTSGYILSCFGIGAIIGAYLGGFLTDRVGYYRVQLLTLLSSGVMLLLLMVVQDFWMLCFTVMLNAIASEAFRPANSVAIRTHSDPTTRTRSLSLMRMSVNLAISFALIVGGYLASKGWHWLFIADGVTCFGAALLLFLFLKEKKDINSDSTTKQEQPNLKDTPLSISHIKSPVLTLKSPYRDGHYMLFVLATFLGATVFLQIVWIIPAFFREIYGWSEATIGWVSAINAFCVVGIEMPLIFGSKKSVLNYGLCVWVSFVMLWRI